MEIRGRYSFSHRLVLTVSEREEAASHAPNKGERATLGSKAARGDVGADLLPDAAAGPIGGMMEAGVEAMRRALG